MVELLRPKVAIVSTSINERPAAYERWARAGDLIVAGDVNSPRALRDYCSEIGALYLTPTKQSATYEFSEHIGWRNIQRRNTAIMWAIEEKYDVIVTVDDDNVPRIDAAEWVDAHILQVSPYPKTIPFVYGSPTNVMNTGIFTIPPFHQRGTPYGVITHNVFPHTPQVIPHVVVSQAQVTGDPDCDAVDRMVNRPEVHAVGADVIVKPGTYAAFNSQATVWRGDWAPVMAVLPHIGRYDDIFAAFIFHRLAREYNVALHVGTPTVHQDRNEHNLIKDLAAELWGMNTTFTFLDVLDRAYVSADMPLHVAYGELMVAAANVLPAPTIEFTKLWVKHWEGVK